MVKHCGSNGTETQGLSLIVRTLLLSYRATRSSHQQRFILLYPGYTLPRALSCEEIHDFPIFFHEEHKYLTNSPKWVIYFGSHWSQVKKCVSTGTRTQGLSRTVRTLPLSYRATRSSHQQLFTLNLPRLHTNRQT